ncbi:MAG: HAMP domain-containing histidine kinase [Labilithrix sp.]|nr:HAMP domain-containing histidine kinase [Labilithrix sp.]MCW5811364.1 HAMP domain-containing histidine kinase [Labilithrix sp.]
MPSTLATRMPSTLATRLGITHGALVVVLAVLLVVTLQGLVRMLGVMTVIRDQRLSSLDAEEELHRAAWQVEVALRHGRNDCVEGKSEVPLRQHLAEARAQFEEVSTRTATEVAPALRDVAAKYKTFADDALAGGTCAFLTRQSSDERRLRLDEELTDTWIDRLQDVHTDIEAKEARARDIGSRTTRSGLIVAAVGAIAAVIVVRWTAASVTRPIARLAAAARRLGEGEFTPIASVGGPHEVEALRLDLERTREKLLGLDRMKQSFLASVSHELRSPLGRLREALALLSDGTVGDLSAQQKRVVTLASRACEQEVRIVEALLDMTRIGSGMPVQREAGCDIVRIIEAAAEAERPEATARGVTIEVDAAGTFPSMTLDSALVERAIANLVRNAVSVSPKASKVRVVATLDDGRVRIDVHDNGPGLDPELADKLFQPFNAVAVKAAGRPAGIGIGLSIVREVARAHHGDVAVSREADTTTFRLEIATEQT